MIPTPRAADDAARLLREIGHRLSRDERDALEAVQFAADHRLRISKDVADLIGRALRVRDSEAYAV